jgi:hypothetical protein
MKVVAAVTYKSLWTITTRKLGENNGTLMLMFTNENYDGKFSSVIYNGNDDKIKKIKIFYRHC